MIQKISSRVEKLAESATLKMSQITNQLKAEGKDIINLSIGEPDFDTPEHIKEAAIKAIKNNITHYPPVSGFMNLRKAVVEKYKREYNLDYNPCQVVISNGAKQSLVNVILCLLEEGDDILVPCPYWVSYPDMIKLAGANMIEIPSDINTDFKITPAQLDKAITLHTRMIIFNSPSNPSGSVYTKAELEKLAEVLLKYPDIFILSDDIYEYINYIETPFTFAQIEGLKDRVLIVNGVSKGYAMTGWRIGYMIAPEWVAKACDKLQGQVTSGAGTISQMAALEALSGNTESVIKMREVFKRRRDLILTKLKSIPGLKYNIPQGAFYFLFDISDFIGKTYKNYTIQNDDNMVLFILEYSGVSMVCGSAFGAKNCIRISYATSDDLIIKAFDRIKDALQLLK